MLEPRKRTAWTDEIKAAFKAEIKLGSSAADIARTLNSKFEGLSLSRNACIGFAFRNNLSLSGGGQRVTHTQPAKKTPFPKAPVAVATVPKRKAPEGGRYYDEDTEDDADEDVRYITVKGRKRQRAVPLPPEERRRILANVTGREKSLMDIRENDCRFPVATPAGQLFCGDPVCRGSYCADHAAVCYISVNPSISVPDESNAPSE